MLTNFEALPAFLLTVGLHLLLLAVPNIIPRKLVGLKAHPIKKEAGNLGLLF